MIWAVTSLASQVAMSKPWRLRLSFIERFLAPLRTPQKDRPANQKRQVVLVSSGFWRDVDADGRTMTGFVQRCIELIASGSHKGLTRRCIHSSSICHVQLSSWQSAKYDQTSNQFCLFPEQHFKVIQNCCQLMARSISLTWFGKQLAQLSHASHEILECADSQSVQTIGVYTLNQRIHAIAEADSSHFSATFSPFMRVPNLSFFFWRRVTLEKWPMTTF